MGRDRDWSCRGRRHGGARESDTGRAVHPRQGAVFRRVLGAVLLTIWPLTVVVALLWAGLSRATNSYGYTAWSFWSFVALGLSLLPAGLALWLWRGRPSTAWFCALLCLALPALSLAVSFAFDTHGR